MENNNEEVKCIFKFKEEDERLELNLNSPNFSDFIKKIIENNYKVTEDNIEIICEGDDDLDLEELKKVLIKVHMEYEDEISTFFENINEEINTYYSETDIPSKIEEHLSEDGLLSNLTPEELASLNEIEDEINEELNNIDETE